MDEKDFYVEDPPARCRICWSLESHVAVLVSSLPAYYASRRRLALLPLGRSGNLEGVLPFLHLLFLCFDTPFVCRSCVCLYTHTERHFVDRKKKKMDLPSEMRKKCEVCDWWKLPRGCKEMKFFILWCWYTCLKFSSNEISFEQVSAPSLFSIASLSDTVFKGCGAYFCCEEQTNWSLSLRAVFAVFVHQCPFPCSIINTRVKGTTVSIWSLY